MKVRYIAFDCTDLTKGNIYECLGQEYDCYRVIDESGEDYLYPISEFEVVEQQITSASNNHIFAVFVFCCFWTQTTEKEES